MTREEEILNAAEEYATGSPQATLRYKAFKDGAEWADAHPAKKQAVTIEAWVARDKNELISLYEEKPRKSGDFHVGGFWALLREEDFSSITFENSPKKVKVTIDLENE